jgi:hypothetical protein
MSVLCARDSLTPRWVDQPRLDQQNSCRLALLPTLRPSDFFVHCRSGTNRPARNLFPLGALQLFSGTTSTDIAEDGIHHRRLRGERRSDTVYGNSRANIILGDGGGDYIDAGADQATRPAAGVLVKRSMR